MNKTNWIWIVIVVVVLGGIWMLATKTKPPVAEETYNPVIKAENFSNSTVINNPYFTLTPGTKFQYQAKKSDGVERNDVIVLNETKVVMGIPTVVVHDQVFLNGELTEDTYDWYAQDNDGNVWYFGEESAEYSNGKISSQEGSWEAGKNEAKPGIVMQAHPQVGQSYYQEYLEGEAEDRADILSLNESVTVPFGKLTGCIKTKDYTPLDPKAEEYKFYCKQTGNVVLENDIEDNEQSELINITHNVSAKSSTSVTTNPPPQPTPPNSSPEPKVITEAQARAIATARVPGTITDVAIETKFGKQTYVVEIHPKDGSDETDVVIDIQTGAILAVET